MNIIGEDQTQIGG